jgi:hypothetical protein
MDPKEFEELYKLPEEDLLLMLGKSLEKATFRAKPPTNNDLISSAQAWIRRNRDRICSQITSDATIAKLKGSKRLNDTITLAAGIYDLIASLYHDVPAATVTVLIVRYGVDHFCGTSKS